jgi:Cu-Zn family superoxide dismutase
MSRRPAARLLIAGACALVAFLGLAVAGAAKRDRAARTAPQTVSFEVTSADGRPAGQVVLYSLPSRRAAEVEAQLRGLEPGFHVLHVHDEAECDGRQLAEGATADDRGVERNALPPLLALEDGTATYTVTTDRVDVGRLVDGDGSSVVVQSDRGERVACGALR